MNTPTPTPCTDMATYPADCLGTTLVTNRDLARALETELTALTTDRDQLRAEVERLNATGSWSHTCIHHTDEERKAWAACPCCAIARAERAEADLAIEREKSERYRLASLKLDAELATERDQLAEARQRETVAIASWDEERGRALREGARVVEWRDRAERAEAELAAERARLDWVFRNCKVFAADLTIHDREDLGVAMKEGAK